MLAGAGEFAYAEELSPRISEEAPLTRSWILCTRHLKYSWEWKCLVMDHVKMAETLFLRIWALAII